MPLLSLKGLSKRYGALTIVDDVCLELERGGAMGIIGPNGAGKTTLFNLITGTVSVNVGEVHFEGVNVTSLPARERCAVGIARSFQIPHPFVGMTTFENVLIGATFGQRIGERQAYAKALDVIERTGLMAKANVMAHSLTLLDRKRLELARALATNPKLLLLDEIAGGLTEPECVSLIELIRDIRQEGVAIIWIEHVVHALLAVVDKIAVINQGKKFAEGEARTVMADPSVAAIYMGSDAHV